MDYDFSEDQNMIRETVRKFLQNECPREKIRELMQDEQGYDPEMWKKMAELGWMGLVVPEEYGGTGMEFVDLTILMEEMGRNILPAPFSPTVALCSLPLIAYGTEEQKEKYLMPLAGGETIWTLAILESGACYEAADINMRAVSEGDKYVLAGTKLFVPYAHVASQYLVVARTDTGVELEKGISVFIVDARSAGIQSRIISTTACDKKCELTFDSVAVPRENILGELNGGWEIVEYILQHATILQSAEMSGGAQAALEIATQYAKERVQFDKPIGSFQAVQHMLADMVAEVEGLRYLVYEAAWNISNGTLSPLLVSMAKTKANKVYERACIDSVVIHGAIGFTDEMDIGLYFVRTKAYEFDLGSSDFHRERIASLLERHQPDFVALRD